MEFEKMNILIAEDDRDDAEIVQSCFENSVFFNKVDLVQNGEQLINFLNEQAVLPHVILTDLNMPKKNGYEALVYLSNHSVFCSIPVFVYSNTINPSYAIKCKDLGAKDFLVKPYNLDDFDNLPNIIFQILGNLKTA